MIARLRAALRRLLHSDVEIVPCTEVEYNAFAFEHPELRVREHEPSGGYRFIWLQTGGLFSEMQAGYTVKHGVAGDYFIMREVSS